MSQKIPLYYALPAIILSSLLVAAIILAWNEPASPPPAGNVPAPVNVGSDPQEKAGTFGLAPVVGVDFYADENIPGDCGWTGWSCDSGMVCPDGKFMTGVARGVPGTGQAICSFGGNPNLWYRMRLHCCEL
jgi:hypothetical protein